MATTSSQRRAVLAEVGATFTPQPERSAPTQTPAGRRGYGSLRKVRRPVLVMTMPAVESSTIVSAAQLERLQPLIEQTIGLLIWFIGLSGSIMALAGNFENWLAVPLTFGGTFLASLCVRHAPARSLRIVIAIGCFMLLLAVNEVANLVPIWTIISGTGLQGILTLFQWTYCRDKLNGRYLLALAVDAGLNVRGYGLVMIPPLLRVLGYNPTVASWQIIAAWAIVIIFSLLIAMAGEQILVRKSEA